MRPTDNLIDQRFGKLVVTGFAGYFPASPGAPLLAYWTCKCDCGKEMIRVPAHTLKKMGKRSCGCLKEGKKSENHLYWKWYYEKRHGTLCEEWLRFEIFKAFMLKVGYTNKMRVKKCSNRSVLSPTNFYFK